MMNGKENTRLVEVQNVPILVYGGTGAVRGHKLNMKMDDAVEDLDIFFPTAEKDGNTLIDDDFQPSPSRFTVAFLIVLSSALNCFIQYTFVSIW